MKDGDLFSYLNKPGELEKALLKKGMTKAEAAKMGGNYMNNEQLMKAREKEQEKMRLRRHQIDLEEHNQGKDMYGNKQQQFGANIEDDMFGEDGMDDFMKAQDQNNYKRMVNGMGINSDANEIKKQNQMVAKTGAMLAMGNKNHDLFDDNQDNRSMSEYYSELFSYTPAILSEAIRNGNSYERFKLCIKFAFSIIHCMSMQDVIQKKPIIPLQGETYEGLYVMPDGNVPIYMESDYNGYFVPDLVSGALNMA